jgi:predicted acylesterase/phospholipase RssA
MLRNGKKSKVALCLAGGGITGAMYEIGCLTAIDEIFENNKTVNDFDIFVGVSAGAIVSTLLANEYGTRELFDGIINESSALNFKRKNIYNLRWSEIFRAVLPIFTRLPRLLWYGWVNRKQATTMDLLSILQEFIPAGVFSLNNLDRFISGLLYPEGKTNDFRNLKRKLYIPATNLDSGERVVFGEDDDTVPISTAVAASAAIPLFFRPLEINGVDYVDGSTRQVAHMDIAIRNGARLIIIINPTVPMKNDVTQARLPTFDGEVSRLRDKGMGAIAEQTRRIETRTRFEQGFERFRHKHPDIDYIVIEPEPTDSVLFLHGVMEFKSRKKILDYGYNSTVANLRSEFRKYKTLFEKHGFRVKKDLFPENGPAVDQPQSETQVKLPG